MDLKMKSDKQFLEEIYQKAERATRIKKKISHKPVYATVAAIIFMTFYSTASMNSTKFSPMDFNRSVSEYDVQPIENIIITGIVEEIDLENKIYVLNINITESSDSSINGKIQCFYENESENIKKGDVITAYISESKNGIFINTIQENKWIMVFSSLLFLFRFLPAFLLVYFIVPTRYKNACLLLFSLFFYAWGEPIYVGIMLFSILVDYTHGLIVWRFKEKGEMKKAKMVVLSSVLINLGLLCFFKYSNFFIDSLNQIAGVDVALLKIALPIGISFYTFQTMSYTIDVYRGDAPVQKDIIAFGAYVTMFPQLIAGPIVRYQTIALQLDERKVDTKQLYNGAIRFVIGLGKKVLLANQIGLLWDTISSQSASELPVLTAWLGAIAFGFQIYFDFSGYSDMAIGLGSMLGFTFLENFNYPYMSKSITEFWRRWHISLGTWFKEYVYVPLGGNRKGLKKQIRNIFIVWLLTGIWHGAGWNFLVWGLYFGVLLLLEKFFLYNWLSKKPAFIGQAYTIFTVLISWVIFAHDSFGEAIIYLKSMFGISNAGLWNENTWYILTNNFVLFIIVALGATCLPKKWVTARGWNNSVIKTGVFVTVVMLVSIAFLVGSTYNPFLYFRF